MEKKQYIAPQLTVVSIRPERGYAFSALSEATEYINQEIMMLTLENNGNDTRTIESFDYQGGWSESDGDGFWTNGSTGGYF
ncbi:MAG: hypothetical protein IJ764_05220 [Bacteroidales bacterium]|nr:hypothetical protein [Bacteroidales bacterium]